MGRRPSLQYHSPVRVAALNQGQSKPTKLKKTRVVHVLDSHQRRQSAKEFIW